MEADGGIGIGSSLETPHWAVRIRRAGGKIAGTGILLSPDRVLTCAHVVARGERVTAEFVGAPGQKVPGVPARVLEDAYRPETRDADGDPSGNVALLRLDRPMPASAAISLYRLSAPNRQVRMYGFPEAYNGGIWLRATIIGGCGRDGQVQLAPHTPGELARPGFSGGGVVDIVTGEVIGMVLSTMPERGGGFSFMSPAETIVQHLPQVAVWTRGRTAVDERLYSRGSADPEDEETPLDERFAQRLADWLRGGARDGHGGRDSHGGRDGHGARDSHGGRDDPRGRDSRSHGGRDTRQVKISLVAPGDKARAATLRRAITLADRELRTRVSADRASLDPPGTVPAAGGLDLAVDATGQPTERIAERIAERMGLRQHGDRPVTERIGSARQTLTLVTVGVDEAADPGTLLDLLALLRARGSRLLLVFRGAGPYYDRARAELVTGPEQRRRTRLAERLTEITGPLAEALHSRAALVRADTDRAVDAVIRAHTVRAELAGPGPDRDLAGYERTVDRARTRIRRTIDRLDELLARRDELRGRLGPYHSLYRDATEREDLEAETRFLTAYRLLHERPCDLAAAEEAVRAYTDFVERVDAERLPGQGGERT